MPPALLEGLPAAKERRHVSARPLAPETAPESVRPPRSARTHYQAPKRPETALSAHGTASLAGNLPGQDDLASDRLPETGTPCSAGHCTAPTAQLVATSKRNKN